MTVTCYTGGQASKAFSAWLDENVVKTALVEATKEVAMFFYDQVIPLETTWSKENERDIWSGAERANWAVNAEYPLGSSLPRYPGPEEWPQEVANPYLPEDGGDVRGRLDSSLAPYAVVYITNANDHAPRVESKTHTMYRAFASTAAKYSTWDWTNVGADKL